MIDIHCHILAEVDDGPKSWDVAEAMCRMAAADGTEHIVATPHANDRYHYDREYLARVLDHLRQRVGATPRLTLGCDFHLSYENLQDVMLFPDRYIIEGGHYLLAELSNYSVPPQIDEHFSRLVEKGITPIITHPERNPIVQETPQRVLQWVQLGCVIQITGSVMTGSWGESAWRTARWLLKHNAVHVMASDGHDTKRRPPVLSAARHSVADVCGEDVARALVEDNPRAIISGQPLPYLPQPMMKE